MHSLYGFPHSNDYGRVQKDQNRVNINNKWTDEPGKR